MRHGWVGGVCKPCADNKCSHQQCRNDPLCGGYGQMGDCKPGLGCAPSSYGCSYDNRGPGQYVFTDGTLWNKAQFKGNGRGGGVWACNLAHPPCPGADGGSPARTRRNGNSGTGQPYLLINFEPFLRASPAQYGNKKFAPGKWDDQFDQGYQWNGGTNREEIPFRHGRWGNGYFCQICVKGGCENMTHLPTTPPPLPTGKGYIKELT